MQAEVRNTRWRFTNRNIYISVCTQRSCKIPTDVSMFLRSRNSMKLFLILCRASKVRNPRWQLTDTRNTHITACILCSCTILTTKHMYSRPRCTMQLCFILCNARAEIRNTRWRLTNRKYVYLSLYTTLLHNYNSYTHVFQVQDVNEAILYIVWCKQKLEI